MSLIIEQEEGFKEEYGMQKIYSKTFNDYVGIGGLIRNKDNVVEVGALLKSAEGKQERAPRPRSKNGAAPKAKPRGPRSGV
jgi:hypothetical protein